MSDYSAPTKEILFAIRHVSGIERVLRLPRFADFDVDLVSQVIEESGKFAGDILGPINALGDEVGCKVVDKGVVVSPEFADAYGQFAENGWQSVDVAPEYGGMGLPAVAALAASETWQSACLSFSLCPLLTSGAIAAIEAHASKELRDQYLPNMVSGAWTGTMNLTEPQAGSDLSQVATRAVPDGNDYRISGSKIFITWGDQDFSENVVHLVLARLPDAPPGVRGLSLFLVPKYLLGEDGSIGARNDVTVASVEHKLGIHASPTCVMTFGENGGAVGYLVGEENKGLAGMFTMMNHARISVGVQGLAISERAYQLARDYAMERKQGRAPGVEGSATIIHHPDIRRMLLVMKSQIEAMRAAAYYLAVEQDIGHHSDDDAERDRAVRRVALLTPVIKAWLTEVAQELTSLGVQIHGGMGFVEETGAAQHMRDARILPIYEGTTGIQALDFVGRKILADEGRTILALIDEMQKDADNMGDDARLADIRRSLGEGSKQLSAAVGWLLENGPADPNAAGSASVNLLMLAGIVLGGWQSARAASAIVAGAATDDDALSASKLATVQFYARHIMPRAGAYCDAAMAGSGAVMDLPAESF